MGHSNSTRKELAKRAASFSSPPIGPPIGPRLILVLEQLAKEDAENLLRAVKDQPLMKSIVVIPIEFPENSPLAKYAVFSVQAPGEALKEAAHRIGLYKKIKATGDDIWTSVQARKTADELGLWRPFHRSQEDAFFDKDKIEGFFTPAEILFMLCDILCNPSKDEEGEHSHSSGNVAPLLEKASEGKLHVLALKDEKLLKKVCSDWPSPFSRAGWVEQVPAAAVASYFGPGASLYFVFMQSYMRWLTVPALLGVMLHIARVVLLDTHWLYQILQPLYALIIAVWSTVFLTNWRHRVAIAINTIGHTTLNGNRPMFDHAKFLKESPKSGKAVKKLVRSVSVLASLKEKKVFTPLFGKHGLLQYILVLFAMMVMLATSIVLVGGLFDFGDRVADNYENVVIQNLPVVLYLGVVGIFEGWYDKLAGLLTNLESHLVYKEYLRSITIKTMAFQLINYLGWFLYLAFWKKDMAGLESQLLVFFTVKQVIGNILEVGLPKFNLWRYEKNLKAEEEKTKSDEKTEEAQLRHDIMLEWNRPPNSISEDYLEIAVLFAGFTWFAPVFPEGAALALIHAIVETWSDRWKMSEINRRSVPQGTNIFVMQAWLDIFDMLNCMGITISMACLFYAGRDLVIDEKTGEKRDAWERHMIIMVEHVILFCWLYLRESMPNVPEWLDKHLERVESEFPLQDWLAGVRRNQESKKLQ